MRDFRDLKVWRKSHDLTLAVYKATAGFPRDELYGLTGQIRRSCSSIPTNVAEGCGRSGEAELARFVQVAAGSASELEYHLLLAHDIRLLDPVEHESLARETIEIKRMLTTLIQRLKSGVPGPRS